MYKKSYFDSSCLGRAQSQHFFCVLAKDTLPTSGGYCDKGATAGKVLVLNPKSYHEDSKDETRSQRAAKAGP